MVLHNRISALSTMYDSCPAYCGLENRRANEFCKGCPIVAEDEKFKKETLSELDKALGSSWEEWSFENLQNTVANVLALENGDKSKWDPLTEMLIKIVIIERNKLQRAERESMDRMFKDMLNKRGR